MVRPFISPSVPSSLTFPTQKKKAIHNRRLRRPLLRDPLHPLPPQIPREPNPPLLPPPPVLHRAPATNPRAKGHSGRRRERRRTARSRLEGHQGDRWGCKGVASVRCFSLAFPTMMPPHRELTLVLYFMQHFVGRLLYRSDFGFGSLCTDAYQGLWIPDPQGERVELRRGVVGLGVHLHLWRAQVRSTLTISSTRNYSLDADSLFYGKTQ